MKKVLVMGASALALGFGMSAAHAEDPLKLTLSGGAQEAFGYVGNPNNKNNGAPGKIWQFGDGSIDFDAKTKLDSGITVEFNASYNTSASWDGGGGTGVAPGGGIGASSLGPKTLPTSGNDWIAFSGSFGKLEVGDDFDAAFQAHNDAPYFGMVGGYNWGRNAGYIAGPVLGKGPGGVAAQTGNIQTVMFDDYEASKVVYTTPSFGGFGVAVSFTPSATTADACCGAQPDKGNNESAAIFYKGDMGDAKVNADVGYTLEQIGGARGIDGGLSVSMKGFTVGGSFLNRARMGSSSTSIMKIGDSIGNTWDIGVGYETGPWGVTLGYMQESMFGGDGLVTGSMTGSGGAFVSGDIKWQMVPVTVKYNLGPGITLNSELGYAKWTTPDGKAADQIDGIYALLGTTVSF